jgi:hypothetical protein
MGKVLHASASGYFPRCIESGGGYWSLEKAMDIYWRVKTWSVSASGTYLTGDEPQPWSYSVSDIRSYSFERDEFNYLEEDLVCVERFGNGFLGGQDLDPYENGFVDLGVNSFTKSGSLYNPFDYFEIQGPQDDAPIEITGPYSSSYNLPDPESETLIEVQIFGSIGAFWVFDLPTPGQVDGTFSLTPTEWWSYGGTYNTSTGARL